MRALGFHLREENTALSLSLHAEATGVWWLPWSSKPATRRNRRVVGSIPIRLRQR